MSNKIILLAFILFGFQAQAQHVCGTHSPTATELDYLINNVANRPILKNGGTTCVPIRAHVVRETNGTGGISLQDLNEGVAYLNEYYKAANIEFYFCGTAPNFIDNSNFYDYQSTEENALAAAAPEVNNAINMFFVDVIDNTGGAGVVGGYAYLPQNALQTMRMVFRNDMFASGLTVVHEMGHHYALLHTFETATFPGPTGPVGGPELVNGSNCTTAGDIICDTPADPGFNGMNVNPFNCTYTGTAVDANGDTYAPDITNTMSYFPEQCMNPFTLTPLQIARIQQGFAERQTHTAYSLDCPSTNVNNPSALTANIVGATVVLNWTDNSSNEMGFFIERSTTSATAGFEAFGGFGVGPNTTTFTDNVTIPTGATYYYRVKASNDDCNDYSNVIPVGAQVCDITAITAGTPTACVPATNTYTQQVTITYSNAPSGTINVNGQTFAVGTSPQTVTLTGLTADGNNVDVTAFFTSNTGCTLTENNAFTAPASCATTPCNITAITTGTPTACVPATNTYTQQVTITYSNAPSGTIDVNGQTFAVGTSPQTVTLTGLTADGNNVDVTAFFTSNTGCTLTENNAFTAPASCGTNCVVGDVAATLDGGTFDYCPGDTLNLLTDGNEVVPTGEEYLWVFINATDTVFVSTGGSFSGDVNAALVGIGAPPIPFGTYAVFGVLTENGATAICDETPGDFTVNVLAANDPACGTAPTCSAGDVAAALDSATVNYCPGNTLNIATDGSEVVLPGELYLWVFMSATDTLFLNLGTSYTGDLNADIVAGGGTAIPNGTYLVFGVTTDAGATNICDATPGDFILNVLSATDPLCTNPCNIVSIANGTQTACDVNTNTYSQDLVITYTNAPTGNINVNGQTFPVTASPQTVTLTGLTANGNNVNATAFFTNSTTCSLTENNAFTAPVSCAPVSLCAITAISAGTQSSCAPASNTYTQAITVTYNNPPSGTLNVNGQTFPVTASPQTVTLTGLTANGNNVNATAFFTNSTTCSFTENNAFTAPVSCAPVSLCAITAISAGTQSSCAPASNTYTQAITVTYNNPPSGTLNVNGQIFPITSSPQTVVLSGLNADGLGVSVTASFTATTSCNYTENLLFTAPASCGVPPVLDSLVVMMIPNGSATLFVGSDVISNTPFTGYYPTNALLDISAQVNSGNVFDFWRLNTQTLLDFSPSTEFLFLTQDTLFAYFNGAVNVRELPEEFASFSAYPTLVNNYLDVEFELKETDVLTLDLFGIDGKLITTLLSEKFQANQLYKGRHALNLSSGMYILKAHTNKSTYEMRIIKY